MYKHHMIWEFNKTLPKYTHEYILMYVPVNTSYTYVTTNTLYLSGNYILRFIHKTKNIM